jgi:hypothetical protein
VRCPTDNAVAVPAPGGAADASWQTSECGIGLTQAETDRNGCRFAEGLTAFCCTQCPAQEGLASHSRCAAAKQSGAGSTEVSTAAAAFANLLTDADAGAHGWDDRTFGNSVGLAAAARTQEHAREQACTYCAHRLDLDWGYHSHFSPARFAMQHRLVNDGLRLAGRASRSAAGAGFRPDGPWVFFLVGPVGVGKGHVMHQLAEFGVLDLAHLPVNDPDAMRARLPEWRHLTETQASGGDK